MLTPPTNAPQGHPFTLTLPPFPLLYSMKTTHDDGKVTKLIRFLEIHLNISNNRYSVSQLGFPIGIQLWGIARKCPQITLYCAELRWIARSLQGSQLRASKIHFAWKPVETFSKQTIDLLKTTYWKIQIKSFKTVNKLTILSSPIKI